MDNHPHGALPSLYPGSTLALPLALALTQPSARPPLKSAGSNIIQAEVTGARNSLWAKKGRYNYLLLPSTQPPLDGFAKAVQV